jgi:hypothetical protein
MPVLYALLIAAVLPGFASMLLGARLGARKFAIMSGGVVAAFVFFGLVWGELLFKGTPRSQDGLIPFLVVWACSILTSLLVARNDWMQVRREIG